MDLLSMSVYEFGTVARNAGWRVESGAPVWGRVMLFRGGRRWCFPTLISALVWYKAYAATTARYYDLFAPSPGENVCYEVSPAMVAEAERRAAASHNLYAENDADA